MASPRVRTSLQNHPGIAVQVGLIVAEYATLEHLMFLIHALISKEDPKKCLGDYYSLRAINRRSSLVLEAAKEKLSQENHAALKRLWRRLAAAANRRTDIAHCIYAGNKKSICRLRIINGEATYELLTNDLLGRTFTQYHTLGSDLLTFAAHVAESADHIHEVMRAIPRAPGLGPPPAPGTPHPDEQFGLAEAIAALSRLGIDLDSLKKR